MNKDKKIDLRDKLHYEAPCIEDFGQIHDVTRDEAETTPWRHLPDGLFRRPASSNA